MVKKMVYEVPELKDKLHLPSRPNNLYHAGFYLPTGPAKPVRSGTGIPVRFD